MSKKIIALLATIFGVCAFGMANATVVDNMVSPQDSTLLSADEVHVNPGALGDALIAGYYNARNAWDFITIVNTDVQNGVIVKIRFREGMYSNEVLDFVICLSAGDRWTAVLFGDDDPNTKATLMLWDDDTVTAPDRSVFPVDLSTAAGTCITKDMTKEGYFEVIAVRAQAEADFPQNADACYDAATLEDEQNRDPDYDATTAVYTNVGNVLFGTVRIYDISDLDNAIPTYAYNMTAVGDCDVPEDTTVVAFGADGDPTWDTCEDTLDGVNYALTKANLYALYDVESSLLGNSDIIVTMPTKRITLVLDPESRSVFDEDCDGNCSWTDDCEECINVVVWDDEEHSPDSPVCDISPCEINPTIFCLPYEVNYITIGSSGALLDTILEANLDVNNYSLGWVQLSLPDDPNTTATVDRSITRPALAADGSPDVVTYGLPVVGYELGAVLDGTGLAATHMLPLRYDAYVEAAEAED